MKTRTQKSIQLFNFWSSVYDSPLSRWFFEHYYNKIESHLTDLAHKHLLSVGCGTGTLEIRLAKRFPTATIVGVDLSEKMLQRANTKKGELTNIIFSRAVSEELDLYDNQFDYSVCIHSFHHYQDQLASLKEFARVLRPGGTLFLLDGLKDEWLGRVHLKMNMLLYEPDVLYHKKKKLTTMLKQAGFNRIDIERLDPVYSIFICQ
jgi:ubiquinone/menaquinone biosynthesis C-methylase UbiE